MREENFQEVKTQFGKGMSLPRVNAGRSTLKSTPRDNDLVFQVIQVVKKGKGTSLECQKRRKKIRV